MAKRSKEALVKDVISSAVGANKLAQLVMYTTQVDHLTMLDHLKLEDIEIELLQIQLRYSRIRKSLFSAYLRKGEEDGEEKG